MSHDRSYLKSIYPIIKGDERFKNLLENDVNFFGLERMVAGVVEFDQTLPFLYEILNPYPNFNPYVRRQPKNIGELSKLFFELISQKIPNLVDYHKEETEGHTYLSTRIFVVKEKPAASSTKRKKKTTSAPKQKKPRFSRRLEQEKKPFATRYNSGSEDESVDSFGVDSPRRSRRLEQEKKPFATRYNSGSEDESVDSFGVDTSFKS